MRQENILTFNDNLRRKYFIKHEFKKKLIKSFIFNKYIFIKNKFFFFLKLTTFHRFSTIAKLRNRCFISGRNYSTFRYSSLSRFFFRTFLLKGDVIGFKRK